MNNSEMPAMPISQGSIDRIDEGYYDDHGYGLTKREYAAIKAMQGLLSDSDYVKRADKVVAHSIALADLLLEALNNE